MTGKTDQEKSTKEYGDYQTPYEFVVRICEYLKEKQKLKPKVVFEPTFGLGSFVIGALNEFSESATHFFGIELNKEYYDHTNSLVSDYKRSSNLETFELYNENIFTFDFELIKEQINKRDELLIIGNPPWVTNSDLTSIGSENLPFKDNFKGLKGLDAITGKGNFDIAEYIFLQLLSEFKDYNCTVACFAKI